MLGFNSLERPCAEPKRAQGALRADIYRGFSHLVAIRE